MKTLMITCSAIAIACLAIAVVYLLVMCIQDGFWIGAVLCAAIMSILVGSVCAVIAQCKVKP